MRKYANLLFFKANVTFEKYLCGKMSKFCSEKFISLVGISAVKLFNGIVLNKYHETTSANIRKIKSNTECYRDYTLKTNTQTLRRKKD